MNIRQLNHLLLFLSGIFTICFAGTTSSIEDIYQKSLRVDTLLRETSNVPQCVDLCFTLFPWITQLTLSNEKLNLAQKKVRCRNYCEGIHSSKDDSQEYVQTRQIPEFIYDPSRGIPAYQHNCEIKCLGERRLRPLKMKHLTKTCRDECEAQYRAMNS